MTTGIAASVSVKTDEEIAASFEADGFEVINKVTFEDMRGFTAQSKTVKNIVTGEFKRAYYVEGNSYQMGYLIGMMAHDAVEQMVVKFESHIIPSMLHKKGFFARLASRIIMSVVRKSAWRHRKILPKSLWDELNGIRDACRKINRRSKVGVKRLLALNMGFDIIMATAYDPESFLFQRLGLKPHEVRTDHVGCNAFSVFGNATSDGKHYMGRDFMFPTGGVFQDVACMTIYNPMDTEEVNGTTRHRLPTVCMTAPGFVGCIAALNENGIGIGVDMLPGANNSIKEPGLNSLCLVRHTADYAASAQDAVNIIQEAPRGVSWLYVVGDGKNDKAVVVEAGMNTDDFDPYVYPPEKLYNIGVLPSPAFFENHAPVKPVKGMIARWSDYKYPEVFLTANHGLFSHFDKPYDTAMMGEKNFINPGFKSGSFSQDPPLAIDNNPKSYYFAPQRETRDDMILVTNMAITPIMRLPGMHDHTADIAGEDALSQSQWRYDALNKEILDAYGDIDEDKAWEIINFLTPLEGGPHPKFYGHGRNSQEEINQIVVHGSTSLLNLTDKTMKSIYGYFGDGPVSLTLPAYLD
ncbi:MAG: carcinine hydrolase/isopenicillin-N N-acyltransferase family protein [Bacteroidota bacterium]